MAISKLYQSPKAYGIGVKVDDAQTVSDIDSIDVTGFFAMTSDATTVPSGSRPDRACLLSIVWNSAYRYQEFYDNISKKVFRRWTQNATAWQAWTEI